jgi:hypothetical protein
MQYQVRELGIGGILDQAIRLLKDHFGLFLGIIAVLYLPFALLQGLATAVMSPDMPASPTMEDFRVYQEAMAKTNLYIMPLSLIFGFVIVPITNAAVIDAVARCYLGQETSIGSSYSHAKSVLIPLLWTWFLQMLAIMGGFLLLIIPGFIFMYWFFLSSHTVVIGGESGRDALSRSKKLMKGNLGTAIALGLVLAVIQWGISGGAFLIPQKHVASIAQAVLGSVAFIFSTVAVVVFYFSCRCKHENFDLQLLAESIGTEPAAEPEPAY